MSTFPYTIDPATGLQLLDEEISGTVPFTSFQYVTVTFNATANVDTDIAHGLNSVNVGYLVVNWLFSIAPATPPVVYQDNSANARSAQKNYIVLRCNVAAAQCTLLLFIKR